MKVRPVTAAAWGVVAASILAAVAFSTRFGSDPSLAPSPLIGHPAPDLTLPTLDGDGSVRLADLQGKVVVVNFYASWCLECRSEHPHLLATADAFAGSGVAFVEISYEDRPQDSLAFLDELGRSAQTIYLSDVQSQAAIAFGLRGVPETFFIDTDGVVQGAIRGESDALLLGKTIDALLRGETPGFQEGGGFQPTGS